MKKMLKILAGVGAFAAITMIANAISYHPTVFRRYASPGKSTLRFLANNPASALVFAPIGMFDDCRTRSRCYPWCMRTVVKGEPRSECVGQKPVSSPEGMGLAPAFTCEGGHVEVRDEHETCGNWPFFPSLGIRD